MLMLGRAGVGEVADIVRAGCPWSSSWSAVEPAFAERTCCLRRSPLDGIADRLCYYKQTSMDEAELRHMNLDHLNHLHFLSSW